MSSAAPVPYIAPWQSSWERFSTQLYAMAKLFGPDYGLTIPDGQWWRVLFCYINWVTDSTAYTRQAAMRFERADGTQIQIAAPTTQGASIVSAYTWGVGMAAYATPVETATMFQCAPLVDMMWPQGSTVDVYLNNAAAGDKIQSTPTLAVEIYTESQTGTLVPSVTPTPLIV